MNESLNESEMVIVSSVCVDDYVNGRLNVYRDSSKGIANIYLDQSVRYSQNKTNDKINRR